MIEASRMMLDFLGEPEAAARVENGTMEGFGGGQGANLRSRRTAKTSDMGNAIAQKILDS